MAADSSPADPVLVWGGGAIGGTMAAYWARAGIPVVMVDVEPSHVEICRTSGLSVEGPVDAFRQVISSYRPDEVEGVFTRVVLAVKALATEPAVRALMPHLAPDGAVLSAQNGLNEMTIAKHVGADRTIGCFVNFAADWIEPGRILFGSRGNLVVGEISGPARTRTHSFHDLLKVFEPKAILSDNIWGHLWGKLGYLSMVYATALTNDSMLDCFADADRFPVFRQLGQEVMAVARARNIEPVGFNGFDPRAFGPGGTEAQARASLAALCEFRRKSAKTHSGIWRDLAVRKRRTEVDSQIALVAELGEAQGVATPMLRLLTALVHDIEEGRRTQSLSTFLELDQQCRQSTTSAIG